MLNRRWWLSHVLNGPALRGAQHDCLGFEPATWTGGLAQRVKPGISMACRAFLRTVQLAGVGVGLGDGWLLAAGAVAGWVAPAGVWLGSGCSGVP